MAKQQLIANPTAWRRDIVLWLLLLGAVILRVQNLDAPPIGRHSWRQADTASIARNYFENGYDFAHPQVDAAGAGEGYCETEFPLYPFSVALLYGLTGVQESWGRLLSAACSLLGMVFMHRLVRRTSGRPAALWSTAYLGFLPLFTFYSRAFMPEAMMLMGTAVGISAFATWTETGKRRWWGVAVAGVTLACLLKITSLYLGLPLAWLAWRRWGWSFLRRPAVWAFATVVCAAVVLWYGHAYRVGRESGVTFGIWMYGTDKWGKWHLLATWDYWNSILFRSIAEKHISWPALPLAVAGLVMPRRHRDERLYDWWLLGVLAYFVIAQGGNLVHEYYQLPVVLPLSAILGRVTARGLAAGTRWAVSLVVALLVALALADGVGRYLTILSVEDPARSWVIELAGIVKTETTPDERGVFFDDGDPQLLYFSHRKGWVARAATFAPEDLDTAIAAGADFVAGSADRLPPWLRQECGVEEQRLVFLRLPAPRRQ